MLFTLSISVFATEEETPSSDIPSIEELQAFFPNLDLGYDGYIHNAEDYKESEAKCDVDYFINEIKEVSKDLEVDFKDYFKLILTLMEAEYERKFKETFKASS